MEVLRVLSPPVRFQITNDDLCLKSPCKASTGLRRRPPSHMHSIQTEGPVGRGEGEREWGGCPIAISLEEKRAGRISLSILTRNKTHSRKGH